MLSYLGMFTKGQRLHPPIFYLEFTPWNKWNFQKVIEQKVEECREPEVKSCSVQTVECGDKCCRCRRDRQERAEERCLASAFTLHVQRTAFQVLALPALPSYLHQWAFPGAAPGQWSWTHRSWRAHPNCHSLSPVPGEKESIRFVQDVSQGEVDQRPTDWCQPAIKNPTYCLG